MFGILNINKRSGLTSRQVVNHVQRLVRPAKAGHAGTLDPLASGVLVVCVGPATRLIEYVQRPLKRYRAAFLLGRSSDTEDIEGNVVHLKRPRRPERSEILAAIPEFVGTVAQRPPAYSALKVAGQRAYEMARRGEPVALKERSIHVARIDLVSYDYPELHLEIECGTGTYVRSLGRDLAVALGTAAVMSELTRTAIGAFRLDDACSLEQLDADSLLDRLLPPIQVFGDVRAEKLSDAELRNVRNGRVVCRPGHERTGEVPAVDEHGSLVAVLVAKDPDWLRPKRVFHVGELGDPTDDGVQG